MISSFFQRTFEKIAIKELRLHWISLGLSKVPMRGRTALAVRVYVTGTDSTKDWQLDSIGEASMKPLCALAVAYGFARLSDHSTQ